MVEYVFYKDTYRGSALTPEDWERFSPRAQALLDRYERIYSVRAPGAQSKAMAVCAMAEVLADDRYGGGAVSSASIGSVSVRYAGMEMGERERELLRCARMYLDIYRGVSGC